MWRANNVIAGVSFVRGHHTLQDEVDRKGIDVCYSSLLDALKGLDADDFSVDTFFSLQDPTSLDDVQASPDFEEDLRTNERLRLRVEIHNDVAMLAHLDSFRGTHDPQAIFHFLRTVLCLTMPIDPALVMMGIMKVEQQQDGHSCEKHVLQMLIGAARKESEGLDRCFRDEGLRYIATLEQV
ncbi:hypothetical protein R1flu_004737 [Riccia fluitans]|uniref:Uncharacterized protein n=1 Tax=Riccia fluitans TaxID=41844 RepID=A0ABD1YR59_9MARC